MSRNRLGRGDIAGRATEWVAAKAEWTAAKMGSAQFILGMTVFITVWFVANAIREFDPDFFLLNLAFSTMASYAAPLILLAQNRTAARDQVMLDHDRLVNRQARSDMEFLTGQIQHVRTSLAELPRRSDVDEDVAELGRQLRQTLRHRTGR